MAPTEEDRGDELDRRLDALEARVERLEAQLDRAAGDLRPAAPSWVVPAPAPRAVPPTPGPSRRPVAASEVPGVGPAGAPVAATGRAAVPGWVAPRATRTPATTPPSPTARLSPAAGAEPSAGPPAWAAWRPSPETSWSLADLEDRLTGRALAWVGGIALILGAIAFISLAFSRGWIGPEGRVIVGLIAGTVALAAGALFMERGDRLVGHVLAPVGLAVITISLIGATRLYDLVPVPVGLAIALLAAVATAVIAVRAEAQVIAAFGLVAVLAAPPLLGAAPDLATLGFIAVALVGTTAISLWRTWRWLPPIAFVLSAPQAAAWLVGETDVAFGLAGLIGFWALHTVASGGQEFRRRRDDLDATSATVMLADAAFTVWAGFVLLDGELEPWRGMFLVALALAYLALGAAFLIRDGERHLFGLLAVGTGIAALTMAAPVQLGAPWVPVAWTAEAAALAWIAVRRAHPYSAAVSAILYGLAAIWLFTDVFGPDHVAATVPFISPAGASLGFFLAGVAAGVWMVPDRTARSALVTLGLLTTAACVPVELDGPATVIAWTIVAVVGGAITRALPRLPERPIAWQLEGLIPPAMRDPGELLSLVRMALPATVVGTVGLATAHLLVDEYAPWTGSPTGVPFGDLAGLSLAAYLVGLGILAALLTRPADRAMVAATGLVVVSWACPTQLDGIALVGAWASVALIGLAIARLLDVVEDAALLVRRPGPAAMDDTTWAAVERLFGLTLPGAVILAGALAVGHVLVEELPLADFGSVLPPTVPFSDTGAAAGAILALAALVAGWLIGSPAGRRVGILAAGGVVAYTIPYEVYAWAVAVLWSALGVAAIVAARLDRRWLAWWATAAVAILGLAAVVAVGIVAPPTRLVVEGHIDAIVALQSAAALGAVIAGCAALAWSERADPHARIVAVIAGIGLVYLLSVAAVDVFATQVGGGIALEELQKQAQVALSILWTVLGTATFVAGLWTRHLELRQGGLALLALATAKVFLVDLAALDVAYRVISLIALGLLLLGSAWVYQHLRPRGPTQAPRAPSGSA